jgi:glucose/arabinose dehydrogenase
MRRTFFIAAASCLLFAAACSQELQDATPTAPNADRRAADVSFSTANNIGPSPLLAPVPIGVEVVASGLVSPVQLVQADKVDMRFVVDQIGLIRMIDEDGALLPQSLLDLRSQITPLNPNGDERGLLGLAFHPDFRKNGRFFVFYNSPPRPGTPAGYNNTVVISEFRANVAAGNNKNKIKKDEAPVAIPGSERVLLQVPHPQANHNGGTIAFGPDGYLYISIGDGGGRDDDGAFHVDDWFAGNAGGNGQDITQNLLGNILRIDVDRGVPYGIPQDNPFVGKPGLDEIFAYGLRNPYRFSFDMGGSHMLLSQDAGQELWEEVSLIVNGGNYGWNVKEGTHCFDAEAPTTVPADCPTVDPTTGEPLRNPVIEFANTKNPFSPGLALTVVGGVVYRGHDVRALDGKYIFAGAATSATVSGGRLFMATPMGSGLWPMAELLINGTGRLGHIIKGFGQDDRGEVYVMGTEVFGPTGTTGKVFRLTRPN